MYFQSIPILFGSLCLLVHSFEQDRGNGLAVFVTFLEGTSKVINHVNLNRFTSRTHRISSLTYALKENALNSQEKVLNFLSEEKGRRNLNISFTSFWISNQLFVKGADSNLIQQLSQFEEVKSVREEENYELDSPIESYKARKPRQNEIQWGISKIEAPQAWTAQNGNNGSGILVGTIDSGARATHEALKDNFVGEYGWFDPYNGQKYPQDESGHGTHTLATIVGSRASKTIISNLTNHKTKYL